jgi:hypothetical protein
MMGNQGGTAQVPTQSFNAANFIGTPVPQVGDSAGRPPYAGAVGSSNPIQTVVAVVILIGIGYLLFHMNFEK